MDLKTESHYRIRHPALQKERCARWPKRWRMFVGDASHLINPAQHSRSSVWQYAPRQSTIDQHCHLLTSLVYDRRELYLTAVRMGRVVAEMTGPVRGVARGV